MTDLKLGVKELKEAIENLVDARKLLEKCFESISGGSVMARRVHDDLEEAWHKVNCCRIHTEPSVTLETFSQTAMSNISDAIFMMESLMHSNKGLTVHAKLSLLNAFGFAMENINVVHAELEDMLTYKVNQEQLSQGAEAPTST